MRLHLDDALSICDKLNRRLDLDRDAWTAMAARSMQDETREPSDPAEHWHTARLVLDGGMSGTAFPVDVEQASKEDVDAALRKLSRVTRFKLWRPKPHISRSPGPNPPKQTYYGLPSSKTTTDRVLTRRQRLFLLLL